MHIGNYHFCTFPELVSGENTNYLHRGFLAMEVQFTYNLFIYIVKNGMQKTPPEQFSSNFCQPEQITDSINKRKANIDFAIYKTV